jgi:hypothetical protein
VEIIQNGKRIDYSSVDFGDIVEFENGGKSSFFIIVRAIRQHIVTSDKDNQLYLLLNPNGKEYWTHDAKTKSSLFDFLESKKAIIHYNPTISLE